MSDYNVHTISLLEQANTWKQLHAAAQDATLFSSGAYLCSLARHFHREPTAVVLMRDDSPVAGIPLLLRRRGVLRTAPPLPLTLYTGILTVADTRLWQQDLPMLLRAVERRCHFVSLSVAPAEETLQAFGARQWTVQKRVNRCLTLHSEDELWEGYSQSLRRKIRRASENDLRIDTDPLPQTLADCYGESYHRHGILPPIPVPEIQRWLADLSRQGLVRMYAARRADGRCVATRALIRDGETMYDWLAGSNPPIAPSGSHWLLHLLLTRAIDEGCTRFDFMGANTPGVSDFKRSFGGREQQYVEMEWYRPALLKQVNRLRTRQRQRRRGL
ncbi:MAG: GNAT family N-acetyltransferase [Bacteroidota bacterium]|nr:GNAT family N-acetyltransferase [Bacteroidota bacterium]